MEIKVIIFTRTSAYLMTEGRRKAFRKSSYMREQGFVMPAMLPTEEIEYTSLDEKVKELDKRFEIRE